MVFYYFTLMILLSLGAVDAQQSKCDVILCTYYCARLIRICAAPITDTICSVVIKFSRNRPKRRSATRAWRNPITWNYVK